MSSVRRLWQILFMCHRVRTEFFFGGLMPWVLEGAISLSITGSIVCDGERGRMFGFVLVLVPGGQMYAHLFCF